MRRTRKGRQWYFGMKLHAVTDPNGIVHTVTGTDAAQSDIGQLDKLLNGWESELYDDQAYWSGFHRDCARASGVRYRVNSRAAPGKRLTEREKQRNRLCSIRRAKREHAFGVVKHLWGLTKVRYREIVKNLGRAHVAFALSSLCRLRGALLGAWGLARCMPRSSVSEPSTARTRSVTPRRALGPLGWRPPSAPSWREGMHDCKPGHLFRASLEDGDGRDAQGATPAHELPVPSGGSTFRDSSTRDRRS